MNEQSLNSTLFSIKNQPLSINTDTESMPNLTPQFHLQLQRDHTSIAPLPITTKMYDIH